MCNCLKHYVQNALEMYLKHSKIHYLRELSITISARLCRAQQGADALLLDGMQTSQLLSLLAIKCKAEKDGVYAVSEAYVRAPPSPSSDGDRWRCRGPRARSGTRGFKPRNPRHCDGIGGGRTGVTDTVQCFDKNSVRCT